MRRLIKSSIKNQTTLKGATKETLRQALESGDLSQLKPVKIHPEMKEFLGYCLSKLALFVRSKMDQSLSEFGVIAPQCAMMSLLSKVGPMTQIELAEYIAIDKATMVRMLDGLEERKYVTRETHATDRRAKTLKLSQAGEKVVAEFHQRRIAAENEILKPLTAAERKTLKELVRKLTVLS